MSLPEGWRETTLGEVVTFQRGFDLPKKDRTEGEYPLMVSNGQDGTHASYKVEAPGIVTGRSGTLGKVFYIEENFWPLNTTLWIKDFKNNNRKFIYYFLKKFPFEKYNSGSGVPTLNRNHIHPISIILPKLETEQKSIANILSSFDEKIELLKEQNETLEQMAQGFFKEWLSENNSEDWEYKKLEDVLEISSSKRIFSKEYVEVGIPFYRSKEIIELSTKPNITTELYITEERFQEIKNKFSAPIKGDILLTSVGTLGVSYQVRDDKPFYFKDGNLTWFKNFSNVISSDYVYLWLKLKSTQHKLNEVSIGSTQKALTIGSLRTLEIPILKDANKAQELFDFIKVQLDKVNHNYEQIQTLQKTRDTLLPKLISGEVRVV